MAGNALEKEMRLQQPISAFKAGEVPSYGEAARVFNVPLTTLRDRISGRRKFNKISEQHLQRFTPKEELRCCGEGVYQLDAWGWPMTISEMEVLATEILRAKGHTAPGQELGLQFPGET